MLADCGPIKRIDLIKTTDADTGAKHSRGFGFVTFALESDATKAVNTIHRKRCVTSLFGPRGWASGCDRSPALLC